MSLAGSRPPSPTRARLRNGAETPSLSTQTCRPKVQALATPQSPSHPGRPLPARPRGPVRTLTLGGSVPEFRVVRWSAEGWCGLQPRSTPGLGRHTRCRGNEGRAWSFLRTPSWHVPPLPCWRRPAAVPATCRPEAAPRPPERQIRTLAQPLASFRAFTTHPEMGAAPPWWASHTAGLEEATSGNERGAGQEVHDQPPHGDDTQAHSYTQNLALNKGHRRPPVVLKILIVFLQKSTKNPTHKNPRLPTLNQPSQQFSH